MRLYYSDIFDNFICSGGKCTDNCCTIGWDIEIDKKTLAFYRSLDTDLGRRLVENIYEEDGCFYMGQEGGCPFMNEKGLCSVQLEYGEEHISDICREHPRFYEWFGDYKEAGVGLCCEEACRMLVEHPRPILFTEKETDEEADDLEYNEDMLWAVRKVRDRFIEILQNRGLSLNERLTILLYSAEDVQEAVFDGDCDRLCRISGMLAVDGFLVEIINEYCEEKISKEERLGYFLKAVKLFIGLDYINDDLQRRFEYANLHMEDILSAEAEFGKAYGDDVFELEHIAVYFIFRYLIKSARDMSVTERIYSAILFTLMIRLLFMAEFCRNGILPEKEERAYIIKEFSKEIEYSEDNMDMIYDNIDMGDVDLTQLKAMLKGEQTWVSSEKG